MAKLWVDLGSTDSGQSSGLRKTPGWVPSPPFPLKAGEAGRMEREGGVQERHSHTPLNLPRCFTDISFRATFSGSSPDESNAGVVSRWLGLGTLAF